MAANKAKMLSSTGKCHTFDEAADGFVPGEGVGVIVLKLLNDALADGDHIYGVIRGSGINQDGTTNGITAPSPKSQERLECEVYNRFHIHPEEIQVIEAHGTGTNFGDQIEYEALSKAFRQYTDKKQYCAIGSVKTNIGHSGTAAGISGIIKLLLSLQHKKIPPSLHYNKGNAKINFQDSPFYVNTSAKNWQTDNGEPRCAAISSFGFSGTNAHIVIQEAQPTQRSHKENPGYLIVVSAQTSDQLTYQVKHLLRFCQEKDGIDLGNMSYTLLTGRKQFNHRWGCAVRNVEELVDCLSKWLDKGSVEQVYTSVLEGKHYGKKTSLQKYGDQCIENCQNAHDVTEYLEHLSAICDLVVQGYKLAVRKLFGEGYCRISLPSYPFAKERYWIDTTPSKNIYSDSSLSQLPKDLAWDFSKSSSPLKEGDSSLEKIEKVTLFLKQQFADKLQKSVGMIDSNLGYFDMGLTSIDIVQVAHEINKLIDPEFSSTQFFEYPTISALADHLVTQNADAINRIIVVKRTSELNILAPLSSENKSLGAAEKNMRVSKAPASFQQQRLWFIDQYQGHSLNYHNAILITLHGALKEEGVEKGLQEIIKRHESLRTNFIEEDGRVLQIVNNEMKFFLERKDLSRETHAQESMKEDIKLELNKSFNLEKDSLIRVKLYKLAETDYSIMINIHHIISDGWSLDLLAKELLCCIGLGSITKI